MDRLACIDLPAFPLQLLLRRHPEWKDRPVAVVDKDNAQGKLLWVNERARASRLLPGMRYAAALSLNGSLCAAEVPPAEIERQVGAVMRRLRRFTPDVEPAAGEPGVFWLDASGLQPLFESLTCWGDDLRRDLERCGFVSTLAIGFRRFDTYALARAKRGVLLLANPREERSAARRVPLDRLAFPPEARDTLDKLGVRTVGEFVDLPHDGLRRRFDDVVARWHRLAREDASAPLQPVPPAPPAVERQPLEYSETKVPRLLVVVERLLEPLLRTLADRAEALVQLNVGLRFERTGDTVLSVAPASPTLNAVQLLELVRLRLDTVRTLPDGVVEVLLAAKSGAASRSQLRLFEQAPQRDLAAAERALARIRAAFGADAVVFAVPREGHLPEARFSWDP
ncbi:MAG: DNA polymerase Y family protein, partial [Planctomycetota bacterium]|nr:DNA polymerase Y family protein [Planctomycetota bacterium]